ncbi:MAG: universal stress protein [Halobacteriaceae archaeon]
MDILVPIDGSETSERALRFAADLADCFDCALHVVHFTDRETEATERIVERAEEILEEEGVAGDPEVSLDVGMDLRPAERVGEDILALVEERGYDHVVMGHHGQGTVERAILGSAAETVLRAAAVPVTVIP